MKRIVSFIVSAVFVLSASSLFCGCGGGGGGGSGSTGSSPGGATFGTLVLSGTGAGTTGPSFFGALTRLAISGAGVTVTQWYNIDLNAGTTYPFVVLIVMQDNLGAVTSVSISHMTSESTASAQWVTPTAPSTSEASATASTVTFTRTYLKIA